MSRSARRRAARWIFISGGLVLFVTFVALGVWQLERLAWKRDLIERVSTRGDAPPVPAPGPAAWPSVGRDTDEYRRIAVRGTLRAELDTLVLASTALGPGFWVLTPLTTTEGWTVLVNRGFIDAAHRDPATRRGPADGATVTVTGLLRITEPGGGFLRDNDPPRDRWYSRDVAAIARARGLDAPAPYFVDAFSIAADDAPASRPWPVPGLTVIRFRDDHLVYALTWFALALMVAAAGGYARWQSGRPSRD
ncbi:MAG: SURF1 family protein [Burkholderiaceae bacterium]